jgi:hypothetical protein
MQLVDAAIMENSDALRALRRLMRGEGGSEGRMMSCVEAVDHVHQSNEYLLMISMVDGKNVLIDGGEHGR